MQWLDQRLEQVLFPSETTRYVYGIDSYYDGPCAMNYDPWLHADLLGVPVVTRTKLPRADAVAVYSKRYRAIFTLPGKPFAVERCAIAHEIVHHEYGDVGHTRSQEDRADRIAARRLLRPSLLSQLHEADPARAALELDVTELMMRTYLNNHHA